MASADRVSFRGGTQVDMPLLVGIVAIATFGIVNLYSATSVYINSAKSGLADIYVSQIYWIVVGILLGFLAAIIDYRHFERMAYVLYAAGLVALGLVFVLGADIRGSSRWIQIGGFSFQPSEFMKILLILVVAKYLHNDPKTEPRTLFDLAPPAALTLLPVIAVMAQPDLGTSMWAQPVLDVCRCLAGHPAALEVRDARLPAGAHHELPEPRSGQDRCRMARIPVAHRDRQRPVPR
jgi:rod shape determining protein RodA